MEARTPKFEIAHGFTSRNDPNGYVCDFCGLSPSALPHSGELLPPAEDGHLF